MTRPVQIIIAWCEDGIEIIRQRRTDLGERPITREVRVPKTALWLNEGTHADVKKARAFANENGYYVFTYDMSVTDARVRAAKNALERDRRARQSAK